MLTLSREVMLEELRSAQVYIAKWAARLEQGIPGIDVPVTGTTEIYLDRFVREMCGELRIVSGKCDSLVEVLQDSLIHVE